jgi:polyvinyl alcohol dehydrogenase (cytochrome)
LRPAERFSEEFMRVKSGFIFAAFITTAVPVLAQQPDGAAVFKQACASCHNENQTTAPLPNVLRQMTAESIFNAMTLGRMQIQAITLSEPEQRAVAVFLAGKPFAPTAQIEVKNKCTSSSAMRAPAANGEWNGWGGNVSNTRFQPNGGLTAADLPKLKLKWAFGYHTVTSARAQPILAGGRLFVASENSEVHALDPKTGCTHWTYKAQGGVRTALSVGAYKNAGGSGLAVFFGDSRANAYAVDANTGKELWVRKVDDHKFAAITGAPTYYNGRLFVPVQGLSEEGQGGQQKYECCTFRGSVSALDASTGQVIWKRYTIDESKPRAKNKNGVQQWGPAGGGIWSSPTVDPKRNMIYVATGNNYAEPSQKTTDAVIALLGVAEPGHDQRTRPDRAAAEIRDVVRARSRSRRRSGVEVPHRPGQRARRPVGRRGRSRERVLRRLGSAVAESRRHPRGETGHR